MINKNKGNLILVGILVFFSLNFLLAQPPFQSGGSLIIEYSKTDIVEVNQSHAFHFHVFNETSFITDANGQCGFTWIYPNGSVAYKNNDIPFYLENEWEITLTSGNFSIINKEYSFIAECNTSTQVGFSSGGIFITPNGQEFTTAKSISYLGFILISILLLVSTIYGGIKVKWKHPRNNIDEIVAINNFRYIKVFLFTMAYFEAMFLFGLSYKFFNEGGLEGFTEFFNFIYQMFLNLMFPIMIVMIIIMFAIWINNKKLSEKIKLGI